MTSLLEQSVSKLNEMDILPIGVIREIYLFLDMKKFSKKTPINDIIESIEVVPWDLHITS